jgi:DNA-binding transcriptional regulator YhcF (GntR family)
MIAIDFASDKPIYTQLYEQLVLVIARGQLKPGDSLPSVRVLGEEVGVNLHTVNKAYAILKNEGFISIHRRRGAVVTERQQQTPVLVRAVLNDELELVLAKCYLHGVNEQYVRQQIADLYQKWGVNEDE